MKSDQEKSDQEQSDQHKPDAAANAAVKGS
jgi:hypothetical protein